MNYSAKLLQEDADRKRTGETWRLFLCEPRYTYDKHGEVTGVNWQPTLQYRGDKPAPCWNYFSWLFQKAYQGYKIIVTVNDIIKESRVVKFGSKGPA